MPICIEATTLFDYLTRLNTTLALPFYKIIYIGAKKEINTPTLPDHILKFQSNPLIRIFRVLGVLSVIILLDISSINNYLPVNAYIKYVCLIIAISFAFYKIVRWFIHVAR